MVHTDKRSEALRLHRCKLGREYIGLEEKIRRNFKPWFSCSSWYNRKQRSVALSSVEAKYMVASQVACEAIWMRKILVGLFDQRMDPTMIYCDN